MIRPSGRPASKRPAQLLSRRGSGRLLAVLAAATLGVVALMAFLIWSGYIEAIRNAETTTRNYALIIEQRLDATLRRADAHLQELARDIPLTALSRDMTGRFAREIDAGLDARVMKFPELTRLAVADADGNLLYLTGHANTPPTNIADRDHFKQARAAPPDTLVFSEVVTARALGSSTVVATRAIRDRQGGFRGAVFALINLDYFEQMFRSLDVGPHGVVSVFRSDDFRLVARWPQSAAAVNRPLPQDNIVRTQLASGAKSATFELASANDGIDRIFSNRVLDGYPFFIAVGLARQDVLQGWAARSFAVGVAGLALLGLLAVLVARLWRSQDQLRQAKALAEAGSRSKSEFLANMSHELRTPLNAIIGFSQVISDQMLGPAAAERYAVYAKDILRAGEHLLELINSILDLSKIEAGKFQLREDRVCLAEIIEASLALVRMQAAAKGVALTEVVANDLPQVRGDETALRQVVVNLLSNAVKFTEPGGRVEVSARWDAHGGIVIAVADTGIGMTPDEVLKAAEPFAQVDGPLNKRQGGTGLGLPISKRLTELLDGTFDIRSHKGVGTTVRVALPSARIVRETRAAA